MTSNLASRRYPGLVRDLGISSCENALAVWEKALELELVDLTQVLASRDIVRLSGASDDVATHALLAAMWWCVGQGSLCLPVDGETLRAEFARLAGKAGGDDDAAVDADGLAAAVLDMLHGGDRLFRNPAGNAPWPVRLVHDRVYFSRMHDRELHLGEMLRRLRDSEPAPLLPDDPDGSRLRRIVDAVSNGEAGPGVGGQPAAPAGKSLNAAQKLAVMLALLRRFLVVSGGPGTGKTQILASLLRAWAMAGIDPAHILLVAPTGRAGKRMGESIGRTLAEVPGFDGEPWAAQLRAMTGMTIHRALKFNSARGGFTYCEQKRLPYRIVVCDEVSMVDVALMDDLVSALPDDARLVFMGDRDQLPSVESGAVLGDIIPRRTVAGLAAEFVPLFTAETVAAAVATGILPAADAADELHETGYGPMSDSVVMLRKSYRTRGNVTAVARAVNRGDATAFESVPRLPAADLAVPEVFARDRFMVRVVHGMQNDRSAMAAMTGAWLDWLYRDVRAVLPNPPAPGDTRGLFRRIAGFRPVALGEPATIAVLDRLFETLERGRILCALRDGPFGASGVNRVAAELAGASGGFFPGCPIMITRNMNSENLYNGETGMVLHDAAGGLAAVFRAGAAYRSFPVSALGSCLPAFAGTVHKSQGSEYRDVIVLLPARSGHPLVTREILYTAITRSGNNVWIIGEPDVIGAAIRNRTSRYSGLDLWS